MKETKRRFESFSFYDYTGIAAHLAKMAARGWMIEKISNFGWVYRRIEPRKLTFSVSYYPKVSEFDPEPTEDQKMFHEFCEHTGWVFAVSSAQMQVFYNERENPVPIETDPVLEIETIHAAAKKNFLPGWFVLLAVSVLDTALFFSGLIGDLIGTLASAANLFTGFAWTMMLVLCVMELGGYFLWRKRAKKAAEYGVFIDSRNHSRIQKIILVIILLGFAYWFFSIVFTGSAMHTVIAVASILYMLVLMLLVNGIKQLLKRKKAPRGVNRNVTLAACFLLSFAMMGAVTFGILRASQKGLFEENAGTFVYEGHTFSVYLDELPLTVEDLLAVNFDGYIREKTSNESLLLGQFIMRQHPRLDAEHLREMPSLEYTITEVRVPWLYDFCKKSLLSERADEMDGGQVVFVDHYEKTDPSPWLADDAYKLCWSDGYLNQYLLCYEKMFIEIRFDWEPTAEQMEIVVDKLVGKGGQPPLPTS